MLCLFIIFDCRFLFVLCLPMTGKLSYQYWLHQDDGLENDDKNFLSSISKGLANRRASWKARFIGNTYGYHSPDTRFIRSNLRARLSRKKHKIKSNERSRDSTSVPNINDMRYFPKHSYTSEDDNGQLDKLYGSISDINDNLNNRNLEDSVVSDNLRKLNYVYFSEPVRDLASNVEKLDERNENINKCNTKIYDETKVDNEQAATNDYFSDDVYVGGKEVEDKIAMKEREKQGHGRKKKQIGKDRHKNYGPKVWEQWGKWSPCSVTCGDGKIARWRHCVSGGCASGEKEAQLKTCSFSSCP